MILMESPRNTPACVNENSVQKLEGKGFILVDVVTITESKTTPTDSIIPTSDNSINYDAELMSILEKDLVFTNKETNPNAISELGHSRINWPIYKVTYPSTAQVGVPFDVIYEYSFVIPDEETGSYVNNNEQCSETNCERRYFSAFVSSFVDIESDNLKLFGSKTDFGMTTLRNYTSYQYHPEFDNTQPLEETFTFVINEPDIDYRIGEINVSIKQNRNDLVYFYVGEGGNIIFDPMMKKEIFEDSSLAKSTAPSVMNTASVIRTELDKLQERTYDATQPSIPAPVGLRDGPPPELYGYFAERLLRDYPGEDYTEILRSWNVTETWIDKFLSAMPELRPQTITDFLTSYMLLPPAYGAEATTSVFGQLVNTDEDGSPVFVHGGTVCAYDSDSFDLNPIIVNNEHVCSETAQSGTFVFDVPTIDPNGSGNTDLVLKAFAKNSHFEFFLNNNEDKVVIDDNEPPREISVGFYDVGFFDISEQIYSSVPIEHQHFWALDRLTDIQEWYTSNVVASTKKIYVTYDPIECKPYGGADYDPDTSKMFLTHTESERGDDCTLLQDNNVYSPLTNQNTWLRLYHSMKIS